jgi:hypothetical protein
MFATLSMVWLLQVVGRFLSSLRAARQGHCLAPLSQATSILHGCSRP